jgi:pimeloyl-ACP methyl ester carboxylesterase
MALILVHGHPFDHTMWRPQVEHFADLQVVTPDLRGYGGTPAESDKTTLDVFAQDIAAQLDELGLDQVVLGGLSMGGQIVLEFHRLFPDRLRGMILADTTAVADTEEAKRIRHETADRLLREGMGPYAAEVLPKMVAPHNIEALPHVAEHVLGMMRATSPKGAAAALRGRAERPDYVEMLSTVAVPTLVVVGSEDEFTPVSDARLMHERIPYATLVVVDGAAHLPNLERRAEFNDAVRRFVDSLAER